MSQPRIQFTERNYEAALNVPAQIARDPSVPIADRLRASKILQDLIKIIWEDELYTQDLANLAPKSKQPVVFVRENLAEEIEAFEKYQREQEAAKQKAEQQAAPQAEPPRAEQQPAAEPKALNRATESGSHHLSPNVSHPSTTGPGVPTQWHRDPPQTTHSTQRPKPPP